MSEPALPPKRTQRMVVMGFTEGDLKKWESKEGCDAMASIAGIDPMNVKYRKTTTTGQVNLRGETLYSLHWVCKTVEEKLKLVYSWNFKYNQRSYLQVDNEESAYGLAECFHEVEVVGVSAAITYLGVWESLEDFGPLLYADFTMKSRGVIRVRFLYQESLARISRPDIDFHHLLDPSMVRLLSFDSSSDRAQLDATVRNLLKGRKCFTRERVVKVGEGGYYLVRLKDPSEAYECVKSLPASFSRVPFFAPGGTSQIKISMNPVSAFANQARWNVRSGAGTSGGGMGGAGAYGTGAGGLGGQGDVDMSGPENERDSSRLYQNAPMPNQSSLMDIALPTLPSVDSMSGDAVPPVDPRLARVNATALRSTSGASSSSKQVATTTQSSRTGMGVPGEPARKGTVPAATQTTTGRPNAGPNPKSGSAIDRTTNPGVGGRSTQPQSRPTAPKPKPTGPSSIARPSHQARPTPASRAAGTPAPGSSAAPRGNRG